MRNRVIVRTNEAARHPFRQRLPRHIFQLTDDASSQARRRRDVAVSDDNDWKLFVLSFTAFFICFFTLIM